MSDENTPDSMKTEVDKEYVTAIAEKALPGLIEAYYLGLAEDMRREMPDDNPYPLSDDCGDYECLAKAAFAIGWAMWHARKTQFE